MDAFYSYGEVLEQLKSEIIQGLSCRESSLHNSKEKLADLIVEKLRQESNLN